MSNMPQRDFSNVKVSTGITPKQEKTISDVTVLLKNSMRALKSALPKHITPDKMCRLVLNQMRRSPELMDTSPESILSAMMEASALGLEIDSRGLAYLVPYFNKNTGRKETQFMPGYKGLMELAYRSERVKSIFAEVVCENDRFDFAMGLEPKLTHTPLLHGSRGDTIAVYAVARMSDGEAQFVVLSNDDIDKIRKASKAGNSGPWVTWPDEMKKKTAIKRLCKTLPLSPEIQRAIAKDDALDAGVAETFLDIDIDIPALEQAAKQEQTGNKLPEGGEIVCPNNDKVKTKEECEACKDKNGCPARG